MNILKKDAERLRDILSAFIKDGGDYPCRLLDLSILEVLEWIIKSTGDWIVIDTSDGSIRIETHNKNGSGQPSRKKG